MISILTFENVEIELPKGIGNLLVSGELKKRENVQDDYVLGYSWQELSAESLNDDGTSTKLPEFFLSFLVPNTLNYGAFPTNEKSLQDFILDEILYLESEGKLPGTWEEAE
jgi:hypothetical protein